MKKGRRGLPLLTSQAVVFQGDGLLITSMPETNQTETNETRTKQTETKKRNTRTNTTTRSFFRWISKLGPSGTR